MHQPVAALTESKDSRSTPISRGWNSATWEISEALIPFLASVMSGSNSWDADLTIQRAIEIREGAVQNPKILSFQSRSPSFPHPKSPDQR